MYYKKILSVLLFLLFGTSIALSQPVNTGPVTGGGGGGIDFLDEDDMASDSATAVPSQQSTLARIVSGDALQLTITDLDNPPVDGATTTAPTSDWAADFDAEQAVTVTAAPTQVTPTATKRRVRIILTGTSKDGYEVELLEGSAFEGQALIIINEDDADIYHIDHVANNVENGGSAIYLHPGDSATYVYQTDAWYLIGLISHTLSVSSIALPSRAHFADADAVYSDTTTPHVLIDAECKGSIITNAGAGEDRVYTFPAFSFGMNGMAQVMAAYQMDLEPVSGGRFWFNGSQMDVDEHIINAADTKGDGPISFWSIETADGTYEVFMKSDNANWAEATP